MKSEENCRNWKTASEYNVNENLARNRYCHICDGDLIEDSFVNWHPIVLEACHKECRDGLPKPEPKCVVCGRSKFDHTFEEARECKKKSEVSEKRYDVIDEPSGRKRFDKTDEREFTIYGQPKWNDDDESMLEEMWKDGKSIEEIADALTRMLPLGYDRSKGAVRARIKKLGIEEKTGRYFQSSGSDRKYPRWNDDDDIDA